ncbi:MAG: ribosomal protein S18-alanine N-acetyltransferase [Candidatus Acidiferrum sp.]
MALEDLRRPGAETVRSFRLSDSEAVLAIAQDSPEAAHWSKEDYAKLAADPQALALVLEISGDITGFLVGRQVSDQAEVLNLAVKHTARRRGGASALVAAALREFSARGAKSVYLEVRQSNTSAIAFYEHHGFSKTGIRPGYYRHPDEAAVTMQKKLTG